MAEPEMLQTQIVEEDVFIPETAPEVDVINQPQIEFVNLADDEDLCEKVKGYVGYHYEKYKVERSELEDLWDTFDYMMKCAQNEVIRETERGRTERVSDDTATKTKSKKVGSTLTWRAVKTLAAQLVDVLMSRRDPFEFKSRYNPEIFESYEQAKEQAVQHNLLMRWTRDADDFDIKAIELAMQIFKYGNIPVYIEWLKDRAEVLDRWPTDGGGTVVERREVLKENRPSMTIVPNECFYADQNIGNIQDQNVIMTKFLANLDKIRKDAKNGDYINVDKINKTHLYVGGDSDFRETKETNAGYDTTTSDMNMGMTLKFDAWAMLPIDETKPKGKRWDAEKHEPKKFWVTIVSAISPKENSVCLRINRNRDPDDEYPFEMLSCIPDDSDKLYKLAPCQIIRGNFNEAVTTKQQRVDANTLNNNRPIITRRGMVRTKDGNFTWGKDQHYECDEDVNRDFKVADAIIVPDVVGLLAYLDADTEDALGTGRTMQGIAMGGRTSSNEAEKAYANAAKPIMMMIKYILHKWLRFYARKCVRAWHIYADEQQIVQISDEPQIVDIKPATLFGDFNIELNIVDDYEKKRITQQTWSYAAQNIIPLFANVLNMRELAKDAFENILHWDISNAIKPDKSDASMVQARIENRALLSGTYVPVTDDEDYDAMLLEHEGERLRYNGIEDQPEAQYIGLLDQHIEETKAKRDAQTTGMLPAGSPSAAPQNTSEGMAAGNEIAARLGAQMGGM